MTRRSGGSGPVSGARKTNDFALLARRDFGLWLDGGACPCRPVNWGRRLGPSSRPRPRAPAVRFPRERERPTGCRHPTLAPRPHCARANGPPRLPAGGRERFAGPPEIVHGCEGQHGDELRDLCHDQLPVLGGRESVHPANHHLPIEGPLTGQAASKTLAALFVLECV